MSATLGMKHVAAAFVGAGILAGAVAAQASSKVTRTDPKQMLVDILRGTSVPNPWWDGVMNNEILPAVKKAAPGVANPKITTTITIDTIYAGTTLEPSIAFPNLPAKGFQAGDAILAASGTIVNCNTAESDAALNIEREQQSETKYSSETSVGTTAGVSVSTKVSPFGIGVGGDAKMDITMDQRWTKTTSYEETVSWNLDNSIKVPGKTKVTFAAHVYDLNINQVPADVSWKFTQGVIDATVTWIVSDPASKTPEKILATGSIKKPTIALGKTFSDKARTVKISGTYNRTGAAYAISSVSDSKPVTNADCPGGSGGKPVVNYDKKTGGNLRRK